MEYDDFCLYQLPDGLNVKTANCIGWLGGATGFSVGCVPIDFLDRLFELCITSRIEVSRGTRPCQLCYPDIISLRKAMFSAKGSDINAEHSDKRTIFLGMGNILVQGHLKSYISPDLIWHYVNVHHYMPPKEYIEAVMQTQNF